MDIRRLVIFFMVIILPSFSFSPESWSAETSGDNTGGLCKVLKSRYMDIFMHGRVDDLPFVPVQGNVAKSILNKNIAVCVLFDGFPGSLRTGSYAYYLVKSSIADIPGYYILAKGGFGAADEILLGPIDTKR